MLYPDVQDMPVDSSGNPITLSNPEPVSLVTALSNIIDSITGYAATDAIMNVTTALTPQFAPISASASGDNTIIADVSDKEIRVLTGLLIASAAVNVYLSATPGQKIATITDCSRRMEPIVHGIRH